MFRKAAFAISSTLLLTLGYVSSSSACIQASWIITSADQKTSKYQQYPQVMNEAERWDNYISCSVRAKKGIMSDQASLASLYKEGYGNHQKGIRPDFKEAAHWYEVVAKKKPGYHDAAFWTAFINHAQLANYKKAHKWFLVVAKDSQSPYNKHALNGLGMIYEKGQGVKVDYDEATKWYSQANTKLSIRKLEGFKTDPVAIKWYEAKAANEKRLADEKARIAKEKALAAAKAEKLRKDKAAAQAKKATAKAEKVCYSETSSAKDKYSNCLHLARIDQGKHDKAINLVADMYLNGNGVKKDPKKSLFWYKKLEKKGNAHAVAQIPVIEKEINRQKAEKAEKERLRLANRWFSVIDTAWYAKHGLGNAAKSMKCEKSDSPADHAKSVSILASDVKFIDEIEANGKVNEVTITYKPQIRGARGMHVAERFFRGKHRCDDYVSQQIKMAKTVAEKAERKLDKYR